MALLLTKQLGLFNIPNQGWHPSTKINFSQWLKLNNLKLNGRRALSKSKLGGKW